MLWLIQYHSDHGAYQRNWRILAQRGHWMNSQVLLIHQESSRSWIKLHSTELKCNINFWIQETNFGFFQSNAPLTTVKTLWTPPGEITFVKPFWLKGRWHTSYYPSSRSVLQVTDRVFTRSIYCPSAKRGGHESTGEKRGFVSYSTYRTNKASKYKIFIIYLSCSSEGFENDFYTRGTASDFWSTS